MKLKHLIIIFTLIAITSIQAWSAGVVQYDTKTGFCIWADLSSDESKYQGLPDFMIFTDKTSMTVSDLKQILSTVEVKYLKKKGDPGVEEMTQAEKDIVDGKIEDDTVKAAGAEYKKFIEENLAIQTMIEEFAKLTGADPIKLRDDIEQSIATKLGLPNL